MDKFEVGMRVRVKASVLTDHEGEIGTISFGHVENNYDWHVEFDDGVIEGFDADDLELAPAQPAASVPDVERTLAYVDVLSAVNNSAADVSTWTLPAAMATPEVKAVLERLQASASVPNVAEELAAQIVHAQMVLQDALGYTENDYSVSLTDLAEDIAALKSELARAKAAASDYRDQVWVHQGTLGIVKVWLQKQPGYSAEDGFTEASILGMVERDLEASRKMDSDAMKAEDAQASAQPVGGEVQPDLSAFARAAQGDPDLAVALYEAAAMTKEAEDMHKRVEALEAELARVKAALGVLANATEDYLMKHISQSLYTFPGILESQLHETPAHFDLRRKVCQAVGEAKAALQDSAQADGGEGGG